MRILVAGFGNVLRSDDAFGVAVIERLEALAPPDAVELMDVGIGGIHMVQMLGAEPPADALVVLDAVEVDRPPGTVVVVRPDVEDVEQLSVMARRDALADMHYATPDRALMLARAMGVLPAHTLVVGCQPVDTDTPHRGMSEQVTRAIEPAVREVQRIVTALGVPWGVVEA